MRKKSGYDQHRRRRVWHCIPTGGILTWLRGNRGPNTLWTRSHVNPCHGSLHAVPHIRKKKRCQEPRQNERDEYYNMTSCPATSTAHIKWIVCHPCTLKVPHTTNSQFEKSLLCLRTQANPMHHSIRLSHHASSPSASRRHDISNQRIGTNLRIAHN